MYIYTCIICTCPNVFYAIAEYVCIYLSQTGNFYSLNSDHEKACTYFRRAVRMDQTNHTSWILLGHEYLELKNHTMAIDAYARALGKNGLVFIILLVRMDLCSSYYW